MFYFLPTIYDQGSVRRLGFNTTAEPATAPKPTREKVPAPRAFPVGDHRKAYEDLADNMADGAAQLLQITDKAQLEMLKGFFQEALVVGASCTAVQGVAVDVYNPKVPQGFRVNISADISFAECQAMLDFAKDLDRTELGQDAIVGMTEVLRNLFKSGFVTIQQEVPEWIEPKATSQAPPSPSNPAQIF